MSDFVGKFWAREALRGIVLSALMLSAGPSLSQAAGTAPPGTPSPVATQNTIRGTISAVRLSSPPLIDGDLSDPVWAEAVPEKAGMAEDAEAVRTVVRGDQAHAG